MLTGELHPSLQHVTRCAVDHAATDRLATCKVVSIDHAASMVPLTPARRFETAQSCRRRPREHVRRGTREHECNGNLPAPDCAPLPLSFF